ncbi:CYTH domain-containing protein [Aurantiacibacter poecillastricola]|uniref:CYTH domain-containing protein n=1 Tax=Aurantiacibacter poecillastricola TaxID=3064385 RepID=UPI0035A34585
MGREIERKFLVKDESWRAEAKSSHHIAQAYIASENDSEIRVRIVDGTRARLTIKSDRAEEERAEFEYDVPLEEAKRLYLLAEKGAVLKTRHIVPATDDLEWEIDVFEGAHAGLVIAEIELEDAGQSIPSPGWLGEEVTGNADYYNAILARSAAP